MELNERMEVSDMDRWTQMTKYPSFLKGAQVSAWLSGSPRFATKVVSVVSAAWRTLACASVMLFADVGSAQAVFTDGEFLESDWDIPVVIRVGTGGEVSAVRRSSGGNPGAYREVTLTVYEPAPGQHSALLSFHRRIDAVYQPKLQGPVGAISFELHRNCIASPGPGCRQVGLALTQGGELFVAPGAGGVPDPPRLWHEREVHGLGPTAFGRVDPAAQNRHEIVLWDEHPDFSASAPTIELGYYVWGGTDRGRSTVRTGQDNWRVEILGSSPGDLNCDGEINALDIEPFLVALFDPGEYPNQYPNCDISLGDINGDGTINALDIEPFLGLLFP